MRICYLCADLGISLSGHSGSSAHVRNLVRAWTDWGHEVIVVSHAGNAQADIGVPIIPVPAPEIFEALIVEGNQLLEANAGSEQWARMRVIRALGHIWTNVELEKVLRSVLCDYQPDFIYERYSPFSIAGVLMARLMGFPHVLNVNAPLAWEGARYRRQALQEAAETLEETAFRSASQIVTTCQELKDDLIAAGVQEARIAVAPMAVDVDLLTPDGPTARDGLDGKIVIGFLGSLKPWHGIEILAEAFRFLAGDARFHLMIVGEGPMAKTVHALEEELPGRVTFVGAVPQSEVPRYLRAMDVAVAPYPELERFYYSPLKVLEYMASGRAVVASRIGQIIQLIREGETGLLVTPGNAKELAETVQKLAADQRLRSHLGARAREEICLHHTWTHRAHAILDFVLNGGSLRSSSQQFQKGVEL